MFNCFSLLENLNADINHIKEIKYIKEFETPESYGSDSSRAD